MQGSGKPRTEKAGGADLCDALPLSAAKDPLICQMTNLRVVIRGEEAAVGTGERRPEKLQVIDACSARSLPARR